MRSIKYLLVAFIAIGLLNAAASQNNEQLMRELESKDLLNFIQDALEEAEVQRYASTNELDKADEELFEQLNEEIEEEQMADEQVETDQELIQQLDKELEEMERGRILAEEQEMMKEIAELEDSSQSSITENIINRMINALLPLLENAITRFKIPDMQGKVKRFSYSLRNIRISDVKFGPAKVGLDSINTYTLSAELTKLNGNLDWSYKWRLIRDSGSLAINANNIKLSLSLQINFDPISLTSTGCNFNIGNLSIKVTKGKRKWLYNMFGRLISRKLKEFLSSKTCGFIKPFIDQKGSEQLRNLLGQLGK